MSAKTEGLDIYSIYRDPERDGFTVVSWNTRDNPESAIQVFAPSLEVARFIMPPGLVCVPRCQDDTSNLLEVWL